MNLLAAVCYLVIGVVCAFFAFVILAALAWWLRYVIAAYLVLALVGGVPYAIVQDRKRHRPKPNQ